MKMSYLQKKVRTILFEEILTVRTAIQTLLADLWPRLGLPLAVENAIKVWAKPSQGNNKNFPLSLSLRSHRANQQFVRSLSCAIFFFLSFQFLWIVAN